MQISTYKLLKNVDSENRIELKGQLLKNLQKQLLEILVDFKQLCEENNIDYSLCGGSALGAVRHKGFIPWDDDIDIFLTRENYKKFFSLFEEFLSDKYYLISPDTTPERGLSIIQIMKKDTIYKSYMDLDESIAGIYIDIFILENAPNNCILRYIHGIISLLLGGILSCVRFYHKRNSLLKLIDDKNILVTINRKIFIGKCFNFFSLKKWVYLYDKWNSICKNNKSKYVVCPTGIKHYFGEIFLRKEYCKTKYIYFENIKVKVMYDVEKALKKLYGNFWELPPESKREKHFIYEIKL